MIKLERRKGREILDHLVQLGHTTTSGSLLDGYSSIAAASVFQYANTSEGHQPASTIAETRFKIGRNSW